MVAPYFQVQKPVRNEQILVGLTVVKAAESRDYLQPREMITIANNSATKGTDLIYIFFGSAGQASTTAWVLDIGDSITDATDGGYICGQDVITAICATANGKLNIIER